MADAQEPLKSSSPAEELKSSPPVEELKFPRHIQELRCNFLRIKAYVSAQRMWDRMLTEKDRERLGGDLQQAYHAHGTAGMWMKLRGVAIERAVIDVAFGIGFLDQGTRDWLLREVGQQYDDPQRTVDAAISAGHLVLIETPRAAFWLGNPIAMDWEKDHSLWEFLWALCERSKRSLTLTQVDLGKQVSASAVATSKGRLVNHPDFPPDLGILVESKRGQGYHLNLPPANIRIFVVEEHDVATEWTGQISPFAEMLAKMNA